MSLVSAGTVVNKKVKPYSLVGQQPSKTYLKEGELKYVKG
jgi:acetyltransferase-like isoleucine patch superfamily enzyme